MYPTNLERLELLTRRIRRYPVDEVRQLQEDVGDALQAILYILKAQKRMDEDLAR
jgi:cell division septum initiation protein DivIVA